MHYELLSNIFLLVMFFLTNEKNFITVLIQVKCYSLQQLLKNFYQKLWTVVSATKTDLLYFQHDSQTDNFYVFIYISEKRC